MIPNVRNGGVIVDAQEVITAVSSVGFPIVACIGLFYLYDRTITLEFFHFLRPEQKFESLVALKQQIRADAEQCRELLKTYEAMF